MNRDPRSKLIVVKTSEGGDAHSVGTNLNLMAQLVFDWLDDVLSTPAPEASEPERRRITGVAST